MQRSVTEELRVISAIQNASFVYVSFLLNTRIVFTMAYSVNQAKLVPPLNFALVQPGVYRSGHPNTRNHAFLARLHLRTIVYISAEPYRSYMQSFVDTHGIHFMQIDVKGNKEPYDEMDQDAVVRVLQLVLDTRTHPILIHCDKGKHRVGCTIACLRKLEQWSMSALFDEYHRICGQKVRLADMEFMDVFDRQVQVIEKYLPWWFQVDKPLLPPDDPEMDDQFKIKACAVILMDE